MLTVLYFLFIKWACVVVPSFPQSTVLLHSDSFLKIESHARAEENYHSTDKFSPGYSLLTISTGMSLDGVGVPHVYGTCLLSDVDWPIANSIIICTAGWSLLNLWQLSGNWNSVRRHSGPVCLYSNKSKQWLLYSQMHTNLEFNFICTAYIPLRKFDSYQNLPLYSTYAISLDSQRSWRPVAHLVASSNGLWIVTNNRKTRIDIGGIE